MFAASKTDSVSGAGPDDKFNYVTMLLHGDGTNGAQNNTFVDSSTNNFSITRNGNTTQGSFSPYGSGWSNTFSGGSYITTASNADFTFGTGDFTIELWMNPSSSNQTSTLFSVKGTDYYTDRPILYQYNERVRLFWYSSGNVVTTDYLIVAGKWQHIAVTRSGSDVRIFYNGVLQQTTTNTTSLDSSTVTIGQSLDGNDWPYAGYISNLRVVKGTALYTSNFTPSTTPLTSVSGTSLLTCQSNRFIDNSASPKTITVGTGSPSVQRFNPFGTSTAYSTSVIGGSGYFDGSGDYLTAGVNTAFRFGTGDFCVEFWCYPFSLANAYQVIFDTRESGSGSGIAFGLNYGNVLAYTLLGSAGTVVKNQWNHIAVSRSGSTAYMFLNGVLVNSGTNAGDSAGGNSVIGMTNETGNYFNGYLAGLRVVKGSAVYTSAFTPPTAPPTAITNTSLLTNFTNGAIYDNAMMNDLETVGNAQISTSVKKYGTGSMYFDGNGDYLVGNGGQGLGANFTIEAWVYAIGFTGEARVIVDTRDAWFSTTGLNFYFNESGNLVMYVNGGDRITSSTAYSTSTWYHVALARSGSTITMYVNGTSVGTYTYSTALTDKTVIVGTATDARDTGTAWKFYGYIDDLRITSGFARYTSTFTPPTSALPDIGPY